jgi:hypothetical protein
LIPFIGILLALGRVPSPRSAEFPINS